MVPDSELSQSLDLIKT